MPQPSPEGKPPLLLAESRSEGRMNRTSSGGTRIAASTWHMRGFRKSTCPNAATPGPVPARSGKDMPKSAPIFFPGDGEPTRDPAPALDLVFGDDCAADAANSLTASSNTASSNNSSHTNKPWRDLRTAQPAGSTTCSAPFAYRTEGVNGAWYKYTLARAQMRLMCVSSSVDLTRLFHPTPAFPPLGESTAELCRSVSLVATVSHDTTSAPFVAADGACRTAERCLTGERLDGCANDNTIVGEVVP